MMKKINIALLAFLILIVSSCVTQKKKGELTALQRLYHNTTAEYNGYFNANVLLTESIANLNGQQRDNYTKILPVYEYVAAEDTKSVGPDLDKAIEKVSIVISLHRESDWTDDCYHLIGKSQFVKKDYESAEETYEYIMEEFNPRALAKKKEKAAKKRGASKKKKVKKKDKKVKKKKGSANKKKKSGGSKSADAQRKEREKERAAYNKAVKKARKKGLPAPKRPSSTTKPKTEIADNTKPETPKPEEEKPKKDDKKKKDDDIISFEYDEDGSLFTQPPAFQEAQLWLARTYTEREKYDQAQAILIKLDDDSKTLKEVRTQLYPAYAHFYMKQKRYEKAIPLLEKAIEIADKRQDKARYAYILAQIYQEANQSSEAFANFNRAMKFSNDYEMEFSARLSMAQNSYQSGQSNPEQITKDLEKFLKDSKNEEYKDQIYYTLANVALDAKDRPAAIDYLQKSLQYNQGNIAQKAESYYTLAQLYFEEDAFVEAKNYYDSTLQVLTVKDERYDEVNRFSSNLTDIAANIQIIKLQDSLLMISQLDDKARRKLAKKLKDDDDRQKELAAQSKTNPGFNKTGGGAARTNPGTLTRSGSSRTNLGRTAPSTFFAYNEKDLKRNIRDFERTWGNRTLADNWRRSATQTLTAIDVASNDNLSEDNDLSDTQIDEIFKDVPQTEEELVEARRLIEDAMMELGRLYRERLQKDDKTVEVLEDQLLVRFPKTKHQLDAWYYLYVSHNTLNNNVKAQEYFDKIVNKYPTSTYARVLKDPNFVAETLAEEKKLDDYYKATYVEFTNGKFQSAYDRSNKADELFGKKNTLKPKFALLMAICTGNISGKEEYVDALKDVVAKYPNTPEQTRAKEILRLLGGKGAQPSADDDPNAAKKFKVEHDNIHYILVVINDVGGNKIGDAKNMIADFNRLNNKLDKLRISNIYLGTDTDRPIMVIRKFTNKDKAMVYQKSALSDDKYVPEGMSFNIYAITQNNYRQILKDKSINGYDQFFRENYDD